MNVLVTAIGSMSASSVIGSLNSLPVTTVVGCDIHPGSWLPCANQVDICYQVPRAHDVERYIQALADICVRHGVTHLLALTDPEVDVICAHRSLFDDLSVLVCLPDNACIELCRDKLALFQHFEHDPLITGIESHAITQWPSLRSPFPWLAKPRRGRSSEGVMRIEDRVDLEYALKKDSFRDHILQPFHRGSIHVVDVVRDALSGKSSVICRKELLRTSNGAGLSVALHADPRLMTIASHIAQSISLHGCLNMEFIEQMDGYLLMDINPRFSAGVEFSRLAGYDMAINHLRCFNGQCIDGPVSYTEAIISRSYNETVLVLGE